MVPSDLPPVSLPLPWQRQEWHQLIEQFGSGRLPHGLLLAGREHIGKTQLALAFSRYLLCTQPEGIHNCGRCHACQLSAQGSHGDFRWLEPTEKSRTIKIDQIRELLSFTAGTAGFGLHKVIVIAPADKMNINAFNALLKLLEEPSKGTFLILICNRLPRIPPTIRSRCQLIRFSTPNRETSLEWLNNVTANSEHSRSLLNCAGGLPMLAEQLYRCSKAEEQEDRVIALASLAAQHISASEAALAWSEGDIGTFLEFIVENVQLSIGQLSPEQLKTQRIRATFGILDELYQLQRAVANGANPNRQLVLIGFLSKYQRQLGAMSPGGTILTHGGEGSV